MKPTRFPQPASANQLLVEFVCNPIAMRPDRHQALVRDLASGDLARRLDTIPTINFLGTAPSAGKTRTQLLVESAMASDGEEEGKEWIPPWEEPIYTVENGIAYVDISGPLLKGYDACTCWWYGYFCLDRLQAALSELTARTDVAIVVLVFNSPGGVVTGIPETAAQVGALRAAGKTVVAFTETMCCSAAYWIGSQCDRFVCTISADVGSIGTYLALYDYADYLKQLGISLELFKRGKFKAIGVMGSSLSKEQRAFLDADVGRVNDRFLTAVRGGRGTVADETMQGQWFDGEQAVELNLADTLVPSLAALQSELRSGLDAALSGLRI